MPGGGVHVNCGDTRMSYLFIFFFKKKYGLHPSVFFYVVFFGNHTVFELRFDVLPTFHAQIKMSSFSSVGTLAARLCVILVIVCGLSAATLTAGSFGDDGLYKVIIEKSGLPTKTGKNAAETAVRNHHKSTSIDCLICAL